MSYDKQKMLVKNNTQFLRSDNIFFFLNLRKIPQFLFNRNDICTRFIELEIVMNSDFFFGIV